MKSWKSTSILFAMAMVISACKQEQCAPGTSVTSPSAASVRSPATDGTSTTTLQCPTASTGDDNSSSSTPDPGTDSSGETGDSTPSSPASPSVASYSYPLLWEAVRGSSSKAWSTYVLTLIRDELATKLLPGTSDVTTFCPRYFSLNNDQRVNFWGLLISAITKYESGFSPTSRYQETTMGTDPITGKPVYSEGLLQLSYQDIEWAPYCQFDWSKDKYLSATDPKKTILNPILNLDCGVRIFADLVDQKNQIAVKSGAYWAVLIPGGMYTKVNEIAALTKKMTGCQ